MNTTIIHTLQAKGLKVTPQRIAIYEAVVHLNNHPTAEQITEYIKAHHPNIAVGTVYKVLDSFVEHQLLRKVKTERDIMRYDAVMSPHHHLYCAETDRIEDYADEQLSALLQAYFAQHSIKDFTINDIKLQITGTFNHH